MTWACWSAVPGPGLATGGSDCSIGPFGVDELGGDELGAAEFGAGARVWAGPGGTEGTSFGGRSAPSKDCAPAAAGKPASHTPTAKRSWAAVPVLVPAILMRSTFRPKSRQIQACRRRFEGGLSALSTCARRNL